MDSLLLSQIAIRDSFIQLSSALTNCCHIHALRAARNQRKARLCQMHMNGKSPNNRFHYFIFCAVHTVYALRCLFHNEGYIRRLRQSLQLFCSAL